MATVTRNEEQNIITVKLEDHAAFQCFQMGINDRKQWTRHPETRELSDIVVNNVKQSQVVVQYNDSYLPLKQTHQF